MPIGLGSVGRLLQPERPERGRGHSERFKDVCMSVRYPGLAALPFKDAGWELDASATVMKPCSWLAGNRHCGEPADDSLSCRRHQLGPLLIRRKAAGMG